MLTAFTIQFCISSSSWLGKAKRHKWAEDMTTVSHHRGLSKKRESHYYGNLSVSYSVMEETCEGNPDEEPLERQSDKFLGVHLVRSKRKIRDSRTLFVPRVFLNLFHNLCTCHGIIKFSEAIPHCLKCSLKSSVTPIFCDGTNLSPVWSELVNMHD